jgi:hypothetical protein
VVEWPAAAATQINSDRPDLSIEVTPAACASTLTPPTRAVHSGGRLIFLISAARADCVEGQSLIALRNVMECLLGWSLIKSACSLL